MLECFFSVNHADRGDLFEGLSIWEEEKYREIQGTYPVISLSFANVKEKDYRTTRKKICQMLTKLYAEPFLLDSGLLYETPMQEAYVGGFSREGNEPNACKQLLGSLLSRKYKF